MLALVLHPSNRVQGEDEWEAVFRGEGAEASSDESAEADSVAAVEPREARPRRGDPNAPDAGYIELRESWHAPPDPGAYEWVQTQPEPPLVLQVVGKPELFVLEAHDGKFNDAALAVANEAFHGFPKGPGVCPRLLELIYKASRHFDVPFVHLVSGIRRDRGGSRHTHGLAADIVLPGVSDEDVAAFFRPLGFIGVGIYTRAGFVHVDVRSQSYFWLDRSPPNKKWKIQQVRGEEAKASDVAALARGEQPWPEPKRLSRALEKRLRTRRAVRLKAPGGA
jgi:hypothetical protein